MCIFFVLINASKVLRELFFVCNLWSLFLSLKVNLQVLFTILYNFYVLYLKTVGVSIFKTDSKLFENFLLFILPVVCWKEIQEPQPSMLSFTFTCLITTNVPKIVAILWCSLFTISPFLVRMLFHPLGNELGEMIPYRCKLYAFVYICQE